MNQILKTAFKDEAETTKIVKFSPSRRFLRKSHKGFDEWLRYKQWLVKRLMNLRCVTCRIIELAYLWYRRSPKTFITFLELMEDYGQQHGIDSFVKHEVSWAFLTNLCNKIIVEHQHVPEEKRTLPGRKNQDRMEHTVNEYYNLSTERDIIQEYDLQTPLHAFPNVRPADPVPGHDIRTHNPPDTTGQCKFCNSVKKIAKPFRRDESDFQFNQQNADNMPRTVADHHEFKPKGSRGERYILAGARMDPKILSAVPTTKLDANHTIVDYNELRTHFELTNQSHILKIDKTKSFKANEFEVYAAKTSIDIREGIAHQPNTRAINECVVRIMMKMGLLAVLTASAPLGLWPDAIKMASFLRRVLVDGRQHPRVTIPNNELPCFGQRITTKIRHDKGFANEERDGMVLSIDERTQDGVNILYWNNQTEQFHQTQVHHRDITYHPEFACTSSLENMRKTYFAFGNMVVPPATVIGTDGSTNEWCKVDCCGKWRKINTALLEIVKENNRHKKKTNCSDIGYACTRPADDESDAETEDAPGLEFILREHPALMSLASENNYKRTEATDGIVDDTIYLDHKPEVLQNHQEEIQDEREHPGRTETDPAQEQTKATEDNANLNRTELPEHISLNGQSVKTSSEEANKALEEALFSMANLRGKAFHKQTKEFEHQYQERNTHRNITNIYTLRINNNKQRTHAAERFQAVVVPCRKMFLETNPELQKWIEALDKEVQDLLRNGVLEIVERTEIKQNDQLIPSLVVCTEKEGGTKKKCRLVAAGNFQFVPETFNNFSTVSIGGDWKLLHIIFKSLGGTSATLDIAQAFGQSDEMSEEELEALGRTFIELPTVIKKWLNISENKIGKIIKSMYGETIAPKRWFITLCKHLIEIGFQFIETADASMVLNNGNEKIVINIHVDDIKAVMLDVNDPENSMKLFENFLKQIEKRFKLERQPGNPGYCIVGEKVKYLSHEIEEKECVTHVNFENYWDEQMIKKPELEHITAHLTQAQMERISEITSEEQKGQLMTNPKLITQFRSYLGACGFPCVNLQYEDLVNYIILGNGQANPTEEHLKAAKGLAKRLYQRRKRALKWTYRQEIKDHIAHRRSESAFQDLEIRLISDSDAALKIEQKSLGGSAYLVEVGWKDEVINPQTNANLFHSTSGRQKTFSTSTFECELIQLTKTSKELLGFKNVLTEIFSKLNIDLRVTATIRGDNSASVLVANNRASVRRARHLSLSELYVRQLTRDHRLNLIFVPTNLNIANRLTKPIFNDDIMSRFFKNVE